VTLENFRTDPDNKNPYAFSGTTDAGEIFSWSGFFYLDPLRSQGELSLDKISLTKYAPLYQDLVRFEIRDGFIALKTWRTVPSLPAASGAWSTTSNDWLPSA